MACAFLLTPAATTSTHLGEEQEQLKLEDINNIDLLEYQEVRKLRGFWYDPYDSIKSARVGAIANNASPSRVPSTAPSRTPSLTPSMAPSRTPSTTPSRTPSVAPSPTIVAEFPNFLAPSLKIPKAAEDSETLPVSPTASPTLGILVVEFPSFLAPSSRRPP